jgi:methylthioxylose transferase
VRTARPQPAGPPLRAAARRACSPGFGAGLALAVWFGLVVAGRLLVEPLNQSDPFVHVANAPLVGRYYPSTTWLIVPPLLLGLAAIAWGPMLAERLSFRGLLLAAGGAAFAWVFLLAMSDGPQRVIDPLVTRYEILHDVPFAVTQQHFLGTFTALAAGYDFHVHAHPPLLLMVFMGLHEIGLIGGWPAAVVVIGVGALAAPAAVAATRALAGEAFARAAAPFLVFAPAAVWIGTSADAFYMGLAAVGIAVFAVAASRPPGGRADAGALAGGLVLGAALFTSYGIVPLGLIVLAIAVYRRAWRALALAAAGVVAVFLAFYARGFSWFDGLQTARELQLAGVFEHRPYLEFLVASPAAFALVVGPAVAVGLARLRRHGAWVLCGAALAGLLLADLSGYARGETERIWLPFAPWLLLAAGAASPNVRGRQGWLAVQVTAALTLQVTAKSPW